MDLKEIQHLIKFVSKSGTSEVSLETDDFKINIKNGPAFGDVQVIQPVAQAAPAPVAQPAAPAPTAPAAPSAVEDENSKYVTIKSPIIGTFYRRPSPDKDAFVSVGDEITNGTVVCIIEAMKLFNEIKATTDCKIIRILVEHGDAVTKGQPLVAIEE